MIKQDEKKVKLQKYEVFSNCFNDKYARVKPNQGYTVIDR